MPRQPGEESRRRRLRGAATPLRLAGIGVCVLVLVVAVAGLAGALDEAPPEPLPAVAVGGVYEGDPWNVTVERAVLLSELSPAVLGEDDHHWLVVVAEVEITADASRVDIRDVLYVTGVDGLAGDGTLIGLPEAHKCDEVWVIRDSTRVDSLHPGLPERVAFLWERSGDAPAPAEVGVELVGKTLRESSLTGRMEWLDPAPRARLTVPLEDEREGG